MADITSVQVKGALKQMSDFVAAVSRAGEILAAVEAAEGRLKAFDKEISAREKLLADLGVAEEKWKGAAAKAKQDFNAFADGLKNRREDMERGLDGLRQQLREYQDALRHVQEEREAAIKVLDAQLAERRAALTKVQGEIDRLKKAFAA